MALTSLKSQHTVVREKDFENQEPICFLFLRVKIQPVGRRVEKSLATIQLDCREAWGCSEISILWPLLFGNL